MSNTQKAIWALRIGVAGEFLGHGLLAVGGKADWIKWTSQLIGTDASMSATIITVVGVLDILVAIIVLVKPIKPVLLWATFWGFWTALVRPLVGVGWLDFVERFANWAAPLAIYYLMKSDSK